MTFADPTWLASMWVVPLVVLLMWWSARRRRRDLAALASVGVGARLTPAGIWRTRLWQAGLTTAALALLILAMAGPRAGYHWREMDKRGVDLVVVLDVSHSMDGEDVSPSRMERARREILDLLDLVGGDRVGMVIFAAGAYPRVPLTVDHGALRFITREVGTDSIMAQGSAVGAAIREGLRMLEQPSPSDRALVLISDGETDELEDAILAAEAALEAGVPIFTVGVGTPEGAPIPLAEGGFKKTRGGSVVVSRLGEDALKEIARVSKGSYVRSVASARDMELLVKQEIHPRLQGGLLGVQRDKVWNERFQWPLGAGLVLLVAAAMVVPRRHIGAAAILMASCLAVPPAMAEEKPLDDLFRSHMSSPGDPHVAMDLGRALYDAGRYDEAEQVWRGVAEGDHDPAIQALGWYDMGLAAYGAGRLTDSIEHFTRAMEIEEALEPAGSNARAVQEELATRLMEPPPEDEGGSCSDGDGEPGDGEQQDGDTSGDDGDAGGSGGDEAPPSSAGADSPPPEEGGEARGAAAGRDEDWGQEELLEGEIATAEEPGEDQPGGAPPVAEGQMSPEQALRLLDVVEEGRPRVVLGGRSRQEQDW